VLAIYQHTLTFLMLQILDIADQNERRLLLQRERNRRWRRENPQLNRAAIERAKQQVKENRRELKRLCQENAQLKMEVEFLQELWDLFQEPDSESVTRMVQ
jgi:hypothetical protein